MIASYTLTAQVAVNTDGSSADGSAMLDIKSTEKGMLMPRMTQAEIEAITSPAYGLSVFCTTDDTFHAFILADNEWKEIQYGAGTITPSPFVCGNSFTDAYDSKSYTTVQIGIQCWMAENLNINPFLILLFVFLSCQCFAQERRIIEHSNYRDSVFTSKADFTSAQFYSIVNFHWAQFDSPAKFWWAQFDSKADFWRVLKILL